MWSNIYIFDLIPVVNLPVFTPIPNCFHYCSCIIELDVRDSDECLQKFLYCSWLFWLFWVICFSFWSWLLFFQGLWRIVLGFQLGLHLIYRSLLVGLPLLLCWSKSMRDLIFSFSSIFFNFFLQRLKVLVEQAFTSRPWFVHSLRQFTWANGSSPTPARQAKK